MNKLLFIFDDQVDLNNLPINLISGTVYLFPLTGNFFIIKKLQQHVKEKLHLPVELLPSADTVNQAVLAMQKNILKWSSTIGATTVSGKSIKDWLMLPDQSGSSWWYSILSEKNAVQETVFFKIAQANAIHEQLNNHVYQQCIVALSDNRLKKSIAAMVKSKKYPLLLAKTNRALNFKQRFLSFTQSEYLISAIWAAIIHMGIWFKSSRHARKTLPSLKTRLGSETPFLFVSYFPNIDNEAAKKGVFRNKYAIALQDKLKSLNVPITWLLMPVYYNGHTYSSSLKLAADFAKTEKIAVLQEFFDFRSLLLTCYWWVRQSLLGLYLYQCINKNVLTATLTHPHTLPIIKYLWWNSFAGSSSVRGIMFHLTYRNIFKSIPHIKTCLYYCEMQAWEKALLHAKKQVAPEMRAFAFQHTVVGRNYYNYFYDPQDIKQSNNMSDFPVPDLLIANGDKMQNLLQESQFPNLCQAEAVRQLYLNKPNSLPISSTLPILLVAGSCDKVEMKSLLSMLYSAYPTLEHFSVWIKASPVMPVEPLFAELEIDYQGCGYKIIHSDVSQLVQQATVSLIANTTVAIEAAANHCPVIVPVFADTLLMNPILETEANFTLVATVEELKMALQKYLTEPQVNPSNNFINSYWNIDSNLTSWTRIFEAYLCQPTI